MNEPNDKITIAIEDITMGLLPADEGPISRSLLSTFAEHYNESRKQISLDDFPEMQPLIDGLVQKGIFAPGPQRINEEEPETAPFSNTYNIHLTGGDENQTAVLKLSRLDTECQIDIDYQGTSVQAIDKNFFHAFCQIRKHLEQEGLYPVCYGASLNVYPSASLLEESGGLIAYRLPKGAMPSADDIVSIFSSGPDVIPVSVEMQKDHFENWPGRT